MVSLEKNSLTQYAPKSRHRKAGKPQKLLKSRQNWRKLIGLHTGHCHLRHHLHRLKATRVADYLCRRCVEEKELQNTFYLNVRPLLVADSGRGAILVENRRTSEEILQESSGGSS